MPERISKPKTQFMSSLLLATALFAGPALADGHARTTTVGDRTWVGVSYLTGSAYAQEQARRMANFRVFPRDPRCAQRSAYLYRGNIYCLRPR